MTKETTNDLILSEKESSFAPKSENRFKPLATLPSVESRTREIKKSPEPIIGRS